MSHNDDYTDKKISQADTPIEPQAEDLVNYDRLKLPKSDTWVNLEIYVKADCPQLLNGLEQWLQLDLIGDAQVKKICRNNLSCTLPEKEAVQSNSAGKADLPEREKTKSTLVKAVVEPNIITQVWLRFLDELSIRWLLFLGIFLVVLSSGVLAASQWDNFPKFGQYLILLAYTFGFWGFSFWSVKQDNLKLTSQTLRAIATLLIPINFWAISHFGLGNNIWEWGIIAISLLTLSITICWQLKRNQIIHKALFIFLYLILSYLHLGWNFSIFPLLAVYAGIVAISLVHYKFLLPEQKYPTINLLYLFAAWALLLARALITSINTNGFVQYNLAIALFAWLLGTIDLTQIRKNNFPETDTTAKFLSRIWQFLAIAILSFTWLLSVIAGIWQENFWFWHTVGISLLAIHLFSQRLTIYWRKRDLTAIFLIGLQTVYVSKELIPDGIRSGALNLAVEVSKTAYLPESVLGVTLFPYVILFIFVATWLYRRQKPGLALYSEWLTLILGIGLTSLSLSNPTWRSLNLLLSTLTLGYVASIRQPTRSVLIYLTHLLGLATILNGINVILPNLSQAVWGSILVLLMAGEWGIYIRQLKQSKIQANFISRLQQSFWYGGLLLGSISYTCFLSQFEKSITPATWRWGLIWLIAPGLLTLIAKSTRTIHQRRLAVYLSCISLIAVQLLVLGQPETRLIALGTAIALMFVNAFNLRRTIVTTIHLGFGLSLIASLLYSLVSTDLVSDWYWLPIGGATVLCLYQLRLDLQKAIDEPKFNYISQRTAHGLLGVGLETQNFKLIKKYMQAADYWAIAIMAVELAIISSIYLYFRDFRDFSVYLPYLFAISLIGCSIILRYRHQPNNLALYTLTWLWALFATGLVMLLGQDSLIFATTNVILGLVSLFVIGRLTQTNSPWAQLNLNYVPVVYAVLAIFWRLQYFNAYTGLLTLAAAFIVLSTQQSKPKINNLINYLGFAGISWGIYELVIYQMQQSTRGSAADGLTILALVAAAIAFTYRLLAWWYRQRQQTTLLHLSIPKVILIAHLHWAMSSIFKIIAAGIAIETATPRLTLISIATSFCLGAYALIQGRDVEDTSTDQANDWWVYVGLVEIAATLVYSRLIISKLSLFDPWRIVFTCAVALIIYQIPWQNFGWRATPWQRTALIIPALMAMVTAEDISYFSLGITAAFYLRIAYYQKNIRWSYISLGFINWAIVRLVWQYNTEFIWQAGMLSLSILYIAQFDPYLKSHYRQRHHLRLAGSSVLCLAALFYQDWGIIPSVISLSLILLGLGLRIRAFLFTGTITLILTAIYQLIILVLAYSFLKWIVGLIAGICSIVVAAGFERKRDRLNNQLQNYADKLKHWQ